MHVAASFCRIGVTFVKESQRPDYFRCPSRKAHKSDQRAFSTVSAEVTQVFNQYSKPKVTLKVYSCPKTNLQGPSLNDAWTTHKFCCCCFCVYLVI